MSLDVFVAGLALLSPKKVSPGGVFKVRRRLIRTGFSGNNTSEDLNFVQVKTLLAVVHLDENIFSSLGRASHLDYLSV